MSEPDAAFMKLNLARADLVRWLDSPVRLADTWDDWRQIPGSYYLDSGVVPLKDIPDAELADRPQPGINSWEDRPCPSRRPPS